MSEHQTLGYVTVKQPRSNEPVKSGKLTAPRNELFAPERQAANFVFPDGNSGNGTSEAEKKARIETRRIKAQSKALARAETEIETEEIVIYGNSTKQTESKRNIFEQGLFY